jgi:two-component system alkaline phosphatase synthesis response regulator PhoP
MEPRRVLVVDDEESLLKILRYALEEAGYEVSTALDAASAEEQLKEHPPDLIVLDVMLPGRSGLEFCRDVRATSPDMPIIMLSARSEEVDRILGLELGADDYVTKPFSPRELVSRVRAHLRRTDAQSTRRPGSVTVKDLRVDTESHQAFVKDAPVHLTNSEFQILSLLGKSPGKVFSRTAILDHLWNGGFVGDERTVDVHVHNLREKIEPNPQKPEYVLTVRSLGYRLREP